MDLNALLVDPGLLWTPLNSAVLVGLALWLAWMALAPSAPARQVRTRMDDYLTQTDVTEEEELHRPFAARIVWPAAQRLLRLLGALLPGRSLGATQRMLVQAGEPLGLTALDFWGLQLLMALTLAGAYFAIMRTVLPLPVALRNALVMAVVGFLVPRFWLRLAVGRRTHDILRALPDALDMLTIGVEAGLGFESAMVRVGQKWDNALTREFRRAVGEMRLGAARDVALEHMAERSGVPELRTFIAVLVQSSQLGVSIAEVLHTQAAQMRVRRRQRAEELARQAGIKLIFPLATLILPALFVVILGPTLPAFQRFFDTMLGP